MRPFGATQRRLINGFNGGLLALRSSRWFGPAIRRHLTVVRYTGRRSGRPFSTPVAFRRTGDTVTIPVNLPDRKAWWRNFTDAGGHPLTLELDGAERAGRATAARTGRNVVVTVTLDA